MIWHKVLTVPKRQFRGCCRGNPSQPFAESVDVRIDREARQSKAKEDNASRRLDSDARILYQLMHSLRSCLAMEMFE